VLVSDDGLQADATGKGIGVANDVNTPVDGSHEEELFIDDVVV
jgi:hypothetical protein